MQPFQPVPGARLHQLSTLVETPAQQLTTPQAVPSPWLARWRDFALAVLDTSNKSRAARAYQKRTDAPDRLEGKLDGRVERLSLLAAL